MTTAPTAGVIRNQVSEVIPAAIGIAKAVQRVARVRVCTILRRHRG